MSTYNNDRLEVYTGYQGSFSEVCIPDTSHQHVATPVCKFQRNRLENSQTSTQLLTALSLAPRMLSFISGSTVDVSLVIPLDLQQTESGQVSFSVKSCKAVFTGIKVKTG